MTFPHLDLLFKSTEIVNQTIDTLQRRENIDDALHELASITDPRFAPLITKIQAVLKETLSNNQDFRFGVFNLQKAFPKAKQLYVAQNESAEVQAARTHALENAEFEEVLAFLEDAKTCDSRVQTIFHSLVTYLLPLSELSTFSKPEIRYVLDLTCSHLTKESFLDDLDSYASRYKDLLGETYNFQQMAAKSPCLEGLYFGRYEKEQTEDTINKTRSDICRIPDFTARLREFPRLKSLDAYGFSPPLSSAVVQALTGVLPKTLTHLNLGSSAIEDLTLVPALPALTSLDLASLQKLPQNITHLLNFPRLAKLHLSWDLCKIYYSNIPKIPDPKLIAQLLELHKLPLLQEIDFASCKCTKAYTLPAEQVLVPLTRMRKVGFQILAHLSQREQSKRVEPYIRRAFALLTQAPQVSNVIIEVAGKQFKNLPHEDVVAIMERLPLSVYDLTLSYLDLRELSDTDFASIDPFYRSYWLNTQVRAKRAELRFSDVEYFAMRAQGLPTGTFPSPMQYVLATMMRSSPNLERLDCSDSQIGDQALKTCIAFFRHLRSLNLNGCFSLTHESLQHLTTLKDTLEELDIRRIPFVHPWAEKGATEFLGSLSNLRKLFLNSQLYRQGTRELTDVIPLNTQNLAFIHTLDKLQEIDIRFFYGHPTLARNECDDFQSRLESNQANSIHAFNLSFSRLAKRFNLSQALVKLAENSPPKAFNDLFWEMVTALAPEDSPLNLGS